MGNMMLAAHSPGLGSIWIHRAKEEFETGEWQQFLSDIGAEGKWEGIGHCAVGYVDGEIPKAAKRKDGREKGSELLPGPSGWAYASAECRPCTISKTS